MGEPPPCAHKTHELTHLVQASHIRPPYGEVVEWPQRKQGMELATEQANDHEHSTGGQRCEPEHSAAFRADKINRRDRVPIGQMAELFGSGSGSGPSIDDPGPDVGRDV